MTVRNTFFNVQYVTHFLIYNSIGNINIRTFQGSNRKRVRDAKVNLGEEIGQQHQLLVCCSMI